MRKRKTGLLTNVHLLDFFVRTVSHSWTHACASRLLRQAVLSFISWNERPQFCLPCTPATFSKPGDSLLVGKNKSRDLRQSWRAPGLQTRSTTYDPGHWRPQSWSQLRWGSKTKKTEQRPKQWSWRLACSFGADLWQCCFFLGCCVKSRSASNLRALFWWSIRHWWWWGSNIPQLRESGISLREMILYGKFPWVEEPETRATFLQWGSWLL